MKKTFILCSAVLLCLSLAAWETEIKINPYAWQNTKQVKELPVTITAGEPVLPFMTVNVLLPFGHKYQNASVQLTAAEVVAENVSIPVAAPQLPVSEKEYSPSFPSAKAVLENRLYPSQQWQFLGTQYYRGYQIALFNVYPYRYNPVNRKLYASSQISISLSSDFSEKEALYQANFHTPGTKTLQTLTSLICNPEEISSYQTAESYRNVSIANRNIDLSVPKQMIIITSNSRISWFTNYCAWRSAEGVSNAVFSTEDIYLSYPGVDNADKIRNFIIAAYQTWANSSQPLEYVILGGDDEIVPERGAYGQVGETIDARMPVDIYYSNLDGNWNANQNQIWGETNDNTDLVPEVHIGRFPAESQTEFNNMFRKIQYYTDNDTYSNNYALFMGENLNNNPLTWGGDYKDDVAQYLPDEYYLHTLYERDGTFNSTSVFNAINAGAGIMNHMGHANEFTLIGQSNGSAESLTNTEYGFLYSQGCYPAAFDQRTSGSSESIGEHLVTASGALFSFIGNTRYGWYSPGSVNGASQFYDRQFFRGLFQQNLPFLGEALTYSRLQNLNSALSNDVMRWCYYEVVLFGDPSIAVKAFNSDLPLLNLASYTITDEDSDNDGVINPGEIIRLYPVVSNSVSWATATNVILHLENVPEGIELLTNEIVIPQISGGSQNSAGMYFRLQLSDDIGFGTFNLTLTIDSQHPITQLSTGVHRFPVSFSITLIDNRFPWETNVNGKAAPLVADIIDSPGMEIIYADVYGNSYLIDNNGELYAMLNAPEGMEISGSFASGLIDGDDEIDLAFCSRTGNIFAMRLNGDIIFNYQADTSFNFTPMLADIDGNGSLEVIAGGINGKIYALSSTGQVINGFPFDTGGLIYCDFAAADFDGNGAFEIVSGSVNGLLTVVGANGIVRNGFPLQLNGPVCGTPTITDTNKIVCSTLTDIYIISPEGNVLVTHSINSRIPGGFVLGDVTADNVGIDIVGVTNNGSLLAFTDAGINLPGFPVSIEDCFCCPPLLANLDSDPQLEIIVYSYMNTVYAYNADGSPVNGFPFINIYNGSTPATLVDFDNNNQTKLVMGFSNGVLMLNLNRNASGLMPWTTYRGSPLRQGSIASTGFVSNADANNVPVLNDLQGNYPNPFNPETTICYTTKANTQAKLEVFNIKGQKIRTLVDAVHNEGKHSIVWNGRDDFSREVASGVYFYRLTAGGKTSRRKMLLLK